MNFWSRVFEEYRILLKKFDFERRNNDLLKNRNRLKMEKGYANHWFFGKISNNRNNERNKKIIIDRYD